MSPILLQHLNFQVCFFKPLNEYLFSLYSFCFPVHYHSRLLRFNVLPLDISCALWFRSNLLCSGTIPTSFHKLSVLLSESFLTLISLKLMFPLLFSVQVSDKQKIYFFRFKFDSNLHSRLFFFLLGNRKF